MSSRMKQRYEAPGPEDEPLLPTPNAWVLGRHVTLPLHYWEAILDFAEDLDPDAGRRLRERSGRAGWDHADEIEISPEDALRTAAFLDRLAGAVAEADALVPEPTDTFPEAYPNEELVRMVRAVQAVFAEAGRRDEWLRAGTV